MSWFTDAVQELLPEFRKHGASPTADVLVSYGFPSKTPKKVMGQCFYPLGNRVILINPVLRDGVEVLAVLTHELVHASLDPALDAHGKEFKDLFYAVGGMGPATKSGYTDEARERYEAILEKIGDYPFPSLALGEGQKEEKKQKTYMILLSCAGTDCIDEKGRTYQVRTTQTWIDKGVPDCPVCRLPLEPKE
jgi:hypothetical protein